MKKLTEEDITQIAALLIHAAKIDENYSDRVHLNTTKKDTFKEFQKKYENANKHLHKDLEKNAEILIMNNSNK